MIPSQYNLPDAYRGDTYGPIQFIFTDGNGNPIDLSQCTAVAQVRNYKNGLVLQWSSLDGTMSISGNTLTFNTVPGDKMKIQAGTHNYDLQINFSGINDTFINGTWNVIQDVTDI
jgi:hypothetical protein